MQVGHGMIQLEGGFSEEVEESFDILSSLDPSGFKERKALHPSLPWPTITGITPPAAILNRQLAEPQKGQLSEGRGLVGERTSCRDMGFQLEEGELKITVLALD